MYILHTFLQSNTPYCEASRQGTKKGLSHACSVSALLIVSSTLSGDFSSAFLKERNSLPLIPAWNGSLFRYFHFELCLKL